MPIRGIVTPASSQHQIARAVQEPPRYNTPRRPRRPAATDAAPANTLAIAATSITS